MTDCIYNVLQMCGNFENWIVEFYFIILWASWHFELWRFKMIIIKILWRNTNVNRILIGTDWIAITCRRTEYQGLRCMWWAWQIPWPLIWCADQSCYYKCPLFHLMTSGEMRFSTITIGATGTTLEIWIYNEPR